MARAAIAVASCKQNSDTAVTMTVRAKGLTGTDGLYIPASATPDCAVVLIAQETQGTTGLVWIKAGQEFANIGQGDLEVIVGGAQTVAIGPLERTRFGNGLTGTIDVDWGITGIATVIDVRN